MEVQSVEGEMKLQLDVVAIETRASPKMEVCGRYFLRP